MKRILFFTGIFLTSLGLFYFFVSSPYRYIFESDTSIRSGKVAKALSVLEEGHKMYPKNIEISFALAKSYLLSGEIDEANKLIAVNKLSKILIKNPNYQNFLVSLAESNYNNGNKKYAKLYILDYLKNHDENEITKRLVKHYITSGHIIPEKSLELWEKAFFGASKLRQTEMKESIKALLLPKYFRLVSELKSENKINEALKVLKKAKLLGKNAEVYYQEALLLSELGDIDSAQRDFEEALHIDPENYNYKITFANVLREAAEKEKDRASREEIIEKVKLILAGSQDDPRKTSILKRIIALNAKYKISNELLEIAPVGEFLYPSLMFRVQSLTEVPVKNYRIEFFDEYENGIDIYQSDFVEADVTQAVEVTCRNPVKNTGEIMAKLFLNDEFVKEYTAKY